jgi:short-subunit dehydrogenase
MRRGWLWSRPAGDAIVAAMKLGKHTRAIVVGASSGIGASLVEALVARGARVAALGRREAELRALEARLRPACEASGARLVVRAHDASRTEEVAPLFEELFEALSGVDLVIYAAAIMPKTAPDEYDTVRDLEQLAVNVGGCIAWGNAAARLFASQRGGTLVGISSIAGERGRKGNPVYGATKAALNHYLEALRNRLSERGAHVVTIKPGFVATRMTAGMDDPLWLIGSDEAARMILAAVEARANERFVPRRWALVAFVIRNIPSFLFKRLSI